MNGLPSFHGLNLSWVLKVTIVDGVLQGVHTYGRQGKTFNP
jgi:hypothetical protein